jgi:hypothetical protein
MSAGGVPPPDTRKMRVELIRQRRMPLTLCGECGAYSPQEVPTEQPEMEA